MTDEPDTFATAHLDGYRITTETAETGLLTRVDFHLDWLQGGLRERRELLASLTFETLAAVEHLPIVERERKVLAAMVRYFNEGGDRERLCELYAAAQSCVANCGATVQLSPACIESEETHARTFRLPDGRYLRIVEDDFSEVMTVDELAMAMQVDVHAEESNGFGFIP
jgi:hypothetical protein